MELSLLLTRSLLLDLLSYLSEHRQEQAIKCIDPAHQTKSEIETLFNDRLTEVIKAENEKTKFFNDELWLKKTHTKSSNWLQRSRVSTELRQQKKLSTWGIELWSQSQQPWMKNTNFR